MLRRSQYCQPDVLRARREFQFALHFFVADVSLIRFDTIHFERGFCKAGNVERTLHDAQRACLPRRECCAKRQGLLAAVGLETGRLVQAQKLLEVERLVLHVNRISTIGFTHVKTAQERHLLDSKRVGGQPHGRQRQHEQKQFLHCR